jgi:hypothetical protein
MKSLFLRISASDTFFFAIQTFLPEQPTAASRFDKPLPVGLSGVRTPAGVGILLVMFRSQGFQ